MVTIPLYPVISPNPYMEFLAPRSEGTPYNSSVEAIEQVSEEDGGR